MTHWRDISTAPRDGTPLMLRTPDGSEHDGEWWADGTSWAKDYSGLVKTGVWLSGDGWFEPDEVTHWRPTSSPEDEA